MIDQATQVDESHNQVPRSRVFVLLDGVFVVRWQHNRVQELLTGQYRNYHRRDFGAPITDFELNQLIDARVVERYDSETIWLCATPETYRTPDMTSWEMNRVRSYYLNTTLPGRLLKDIVDLLDDLELSDEYMPRVRDDFVILWGEQGRAFNRFETAERARERLASRSPEAFSNTVVAFVETNALG